MPSTPPTRVPIAEPHRNARAADVVRLRAEVLRVELRVGEPFRPRSLRIVALDASGTVLPRVPLKVEVNGPAKAFARDNLQRTADGSMTPTISISVQFRVRTICIGAGAETFVPADISRQ